MGRLTLNPGAHYDLFGTIILPLALLPSIWGFLVTQNQFLSTLATSRIIENRFFGLALPASIANIILMIVSGFLLALIRTKLSADFYLMNEFTNMLVWSIFINIFLAVFNLIPFPPLDGSRMLSSFLSYENQRKYEDLQRFSFLFFFYYSLDHQCVSISNDSRPKNRLGSCWDICLDAWIGE